MKLPLLAISISAAIYFLADWFGLSSASIHLDSNQALILLQAFAVTISVMVLVWAAIISERKRAEKRLAIQYAIGRTLAESTTLAEASPKILQSICENFHWDMGAIWRVDRTANHLQCVEIWAVPAIAREEFAALTRKTHFASGIGLPGRVWLSNQPAWLPDVTEDLNFPRASAARETKLHGAFAFPIRSSEEVVGVIEFFSREIRQPDRKLLDLFAAIGHQLGQFMTRNQAESALVEEHNLLRTLINHLPDYIFVKDLKGRYIVKNEANLKILGINSIEDVLGKTASEIYSPEAAAHCIKDDEIVFNSGQPLLDQEEPFLDRNGRRHLLLTTKVPLRDQRGQVIGLVGISRDITERKHAEEALHKSESQLRLVWENSLDGMRLVNEDGILLAVNEAYCRLMERPREFLEGKPFSVVYELSQREAIQRKHQERFRNRTIAPHLERELVLWNGRKIYLELSNSFLEVEGQPPLLLNIFRDITERKRSEILREEFSILGQRLSAATTPEEAARTIVAAADNLFGWDACAVDSYAAERDEIYPILTIDTIDGQRIDVAPTNVGNKPTSRIRQAIRKGGFAIFRDEMEVAPADVMPFGDTTRPSASILIVPIRNGKRVTGVLSLHSYTLNAYSQADLSTLQALADHCGGALERIHVAQELRKQQEFLRTVFDMVPSMIFVKDRQGRFTLTNRTNAEILGITPDQMIGKTDAELNNHPDEVAQYTKDDLQVFTTGQDKFILEERATDTNGNVLWLQTFKRPLLGPDGKATHVVGIATDITTRKRVELRNSALANLGHQLSSATLPVEAARTIGEIADQLFGWDAFTLNLYSFENDTAKIQPIYNVDTIASQRTEIPNVEVRQNFSPRDRRIVEIGGELILKKEPITMSSELSAFGDISRPSASLMFVPIRNRTRVIGIISVQSYKLNAFDREDLMVLQTLADHCGAALERIRAETALRESDALKTAIMESALDCIITMDRDGKILEFNSAAQKTFGYSREQAIGKEMAELIIPPAFRERHRQGLARYLATGENLVMGRRIEVLGMRADGSEFPIEVAITPILMESGPIFTGYLRDITERKRAERANRELPGQILEAQESERMRVARELHDSVNQILSSTKFRLDSVEEKDIRPDNSGAENLAKSKELLDKAMHEVWRISRNLRPSELDDLGLVPAVRSLCHEFMERTGINVDLKLLRAPELTPEIELTLYRIIQEALNNVEKHSEATEVKLSITQKPAWLVLHIEDNGIGFNPAQGMARPKKSGMGLIGMKERAAFVGGVVEVKTTPDKGTAIEVRIPMNKSA